MEISKRQFEIIEYLLKQQNFVTSSELASLFHVSSRTIKSELSKIVDFKDLIGVDVTSAREGYKVTISDQEVYGVSVKRNREKIDFNLSADRIRFIITEFIKRDLKVKEKSILDTMTISSQTLSRDMNNIKHLVAADGLSLSKRNGYYQILGDENLLRSFISKYLDIDFSSIDNYFRLLMNYDFNPDKVKSFTNKVISILQSYKKDLIGLNITNLLIHLVVSVYRVRNGFEIKEITLKSDDNLIELELAKKIVAVVQDYFDVTFPNSETIYLGYSLIGKGFNSCRSKDVDEVIKRTYKDISDNFNIDLDLGNDYSNALYFHIIAMKDRLKFGVTIDSSIIEMVKTKFILAYEMAVIFHHNYYSMFNISLNDVEVSYIALHFGAMISGQNQNKDIPNGIIVTEVRTGGALLLKNSFLSRYGQHISISNVYSPFELNHLNTNQFDFIFTTENLKPLITKAKIVKIPMMLDDESDEIIVRALKEKMDFSSIFLEKLFKVYHHNNVDVKEILLDSCKTFETYGLIDEANDFLDQTLIREKYQSTHISRNFALPHAMSAISKKSFISVQIFKQGIRWFDDEIVKLVMFVGINPKDKDKIKDVFSVLSNISSDELLTDRIIQSKGYEDFLDIIKNTKLITEENV